MTHNNMGSGLILPQRKEKMFQLFKYTIYGLLLYSVGFFLWQDYSALVHTHSDGISFKDIGEAFAQSLDTFAWYILLILFELETYVIESDETHRRYKWLLRTIYLICYATITWALIGYIEKMLMVYAFDVSPLKDACQMVGTQVKSLALELDEYVTLTADNCSQLVQPLYVNSNIGMVSGSDVLLSMKRMASTDVLNAATWLLIVVVLQIDVLLQLWGRLTTALYKINLYIKITLYIILFICAGYWWFFGTYIDFQDAALWILAFFFIELNLFKWHEEENMPEAEHIHPHPHEEGL